MDKLEGYLNFRRTHHPPKYQAIGNVKLQYIDVPSAISLKTRKPLFFMVNNPTTDAPQLSIVEWSIENIKGSFSVFIDGTNCVLTRNVKNPFLILYIIPDVSSFQPVSLTRLTQSYQFPAAHILLKRLLLNKETATCTLVLRSPLDIRAYQSSIGGRFWQVDLLTSVIPAFPLLASSKPNKADELKSLINGLLPLTVKLST